MSVTPTALIDAEREAGGEREEDRDRARQRHVGDVHVGFLQREIGDDDAGGVGDRGDREVDLGAQDHEGQPDRDDRRDRDLVQDVDEVGDGAGTRGSRR